MTVKLEHLSTRASKHLKTFFVLSPMPCVTGKKIYDTLEMAEDGLIETWIRFKVGAGNGPVAIYKCDDCGFYHLTSRGPMNEKLAAHIADGKIKKQSDINFWEDKFKKR